MSARGSAVEPTVVLVDDDPGVLRELTRLVRSAGLAVETCGSAREVLARPGIGRPGCLVVDLRMPELDGVSLQRLIAGDDDPLPVVFLSGQGDVRSGVAAMKAGAVDFLTKPCTAGELLDAIRRALERDAAARAARRERHALEARFATLTRREGEVCELVAAGALNKEAAFALGITEKTVKVHRARVMAKMGARSLVELVRMVDRLRAP